MPARDAAGSALEQEASASQADTEPLSFEEDDGEEDAGAHTTDNQQAFSNMSDAGADADAPGSVQASPIDASMEDSSAANEAFMDASPTHKGQVDEFDDEGDDIDAVGSDEEDIDGADDTQPGTATGDDNAPQASARAGGAAFSDDSDLTDESDDNGNDEDAEGEDEDNDDDEMGGDDSDEEEEEDDEEEGDDEDADAEGDEEDDDDGQDEDEDEALKGLAALTAAGQVGASDADANGELDLAASGLDGLAVLAAAGANDAAGGDSDADSTTSSTRAASIKARRGRLMSKPRLGSRLNEVMVASEPTSELDADGHEDEEDDDEEEGEDHIGGEADGVEDEEAPRSKPTSRNMSSLGHLATAARRTVGRAGASVGLLAGAPSITIDEAASGAASLASSREASPKLEDEDEERTVRQVTDKDDDEKDAKDDEGDDKELGTPLQELDEAVAEEDPSTDEAAVKRQEAMETLTKIEIGFAVLRDKLYVERMEEISKEGEMILEGTHPDLIYLTNFIEARRERRLRLVEMWFEQQQKQYERVAHAEEAAAWNSWRNEVVQLRKRQLDDVSRKRRKLDREKRTLDGPRPARRHQIFETELVRNPDYDAAQAKHSNGNKGKRKGTPRQQEMEDLEEMGAYVAYPDLRSADDGEAWMDMDRMGIQADVRIMPGMGYYVDGGSGGGGAAVDPYGMYMLDQGQHQRPPGGPDMMPPYVEAGGSGGAQGRSHPSNGVMDDRAFDSRGRPVPGGGVREVDGGYIVDEGDAGPQMGNYGGRGRPAGVGRDLDDGFIIDDHAKAGPPMGNYGGGGHPSGRMGHQHHPDDMYIDGADSAGMPLHGILPPRNRLGSPQGGSRVIKLQDERMQGRKSESQVFKRSHPRSPPPSAANRKRMLSHGSSGGGGPRPHHAMDGDPQQQGSLGRAGPYGAYGGGPPPPHGGNMMEDGYYEGGPPPAGYGPPRPPPSGGPGSGPGYGSGSMMGPSDSGPPPPAQMGHPMHGAYPPPPPPGRRPAEAMYQR